MQMDDQTNNGFDTIKEILEAHSNRLATLEERNRTLERKEETQSNRIATLEERNRSLESKEKTQSNRIATLEERNRSLESKEEHYQSLEHALIQTYGVLTPFFVANNQEEKQQPQDMLLDRPIKVKRNNVVVVSDSHSPSNIKKTPKRKNRESISEEEEEEEEEDDEEEEEESSEIDEESDSEESPKMTTKDKLDKYLKAICAPTPKKTKAPNKRVEIEGWKRIRGPKGSDGKRRSRIQCIHCSHQVDRPSRTEKHKCPAKLRIQPTFAALVPLHREPIEESTLEGTLVNAPGKQSK